MLNVLRVLFLTYKATFFFYSTPQLPRGHRERLGVHRGGEAERPVPYAVRVPPVGPGEFCIVCPTAMVNVFYFGDRVVVRFLTILICLTLVHSLAT